MTRKVLVILSNFHTITSKQKQYFIPMQLGRDWVREAVGVAVDLRPSYLDREALQDASVFPGSDAIWV